MADRKTSLTPEEKITAAFMHHVRNIDQQDIATIYGLNIGRVSEACRDIALASGLKPPQNNFAPGNFTELKIKA